MKGRKNTGENKKGCKGKTLGSVNSLKLFCLKVVVWLN